MMENAPQWPQRLTREQQKIVKQRSKAFQVALKAATRGTEWRYARETLFRRKDDWFGSNLPYLLWERGVSVSLAVKPMALDPLFWEIEGLQDNNAQPLSFRATGAWVLTPPSFNEYIAIDKTDPEELARIAFEWSELKMTDLATTWSTDKTIEKIRERPDIRQHYLASEICLLILQDDLDGALELCRAEGDGSGWSSRETGGFMSTAADGSVVTFIEKARSWIVERRRGRLRLA